MRLVHYAKKHDLTFIIEIYNLSERVNKYIIRVNLLSLRTFVMKTDCIGY